MGAITAIIFFILAVGYAAKLYNRRRWRRKNRMFGYFEYEYNGEIETSRDYGPMQEIDAVGAMNYRQQLGAIITYEKFSPDIEEIHDVIDERQYMHDKRKQRRGYK
ncbi:hypothetical protein CL97_gp156 [Cronobacter phage CR9]|uniref:Uncharacterized protein n=1 Tax=Cronobacter phage CR9 TaxID=1162290 RepID=M1F3M0_9CAUD|nr:hypothetical protein CL97_gp156 [Cronobacter phage CR9]AFH21040.1 hypothetical protein CR9_156 [Cronobacter phage CR9]